MLKFILSQVRTLRLVSYDQVDLKVVYFHIQIVQRHKLFFRFAFGGKAYHFLVLLFGLALAL